jgi:hypothetical protein
MKDHHNRSERGVEDLRDLPAGEDLEDPYADVAVETLPAWWRDAIEEYDTAGLRRYRPSRFRDGTFVEPLLSRLRITYDVSIVLLGENVEHDDQWSLVVDGTTVAEFGHRRVPDGYSVYDIDGDSVVELVERHLPTTG